MCPFDDAGWEIQSENNLIIHRNGFKAEYRHAAIYSIKHFPYDATIQDIRNWVKKAEALLAARDGSGKGPAQRHK